MSREVTGHGSTTVTFEGMRPDQLLIMINGLQPLLGLGRGDVTLMDSGPPPSTSLLAHNVDIGQGIKTMVANAVSQNLGDEFGAHLQRAVFGGEDVYEAAHSQATPIVKSMGKIGPIVDV